MVTISKEAPELKRLGSNLTKAGVYRVVVMMSWVGAKHRPMSSVIILSKLGGRMDMGILSNPLHPGAPTTNNDILSMFITGSLIVSHEGIVAVKYLIDPTDWSITREEVQLKPGITHDDLSALVHGHSPSRKFERGPGQTEGDRIGAV